MTREQFVLKYGLLTEKQFIAKFRSGDEEFFDDVMNKWKAHPGGEKTERLSLSEGTTEEKLKASLDLLFS